MKESFEMEEKINVNKIQTKPHHGIRHREPGAFILRDGKLISEKEASEFVEPKIYKQEPATETGKEK